LEANQLLISWLGAGSIILGKRFTKVTIGSPIIVGVMKEINIFLFIFSSQGLSCFIDSMFLGTGLGEKLNIFTFTLKIMNRVKIIEMMVVNHIDVLSSGISLWRVGSLSLT
jgi:hypothetical protein